MNRPLLLVSLTFDFNWIDGNIILDRDVWCGSERKYGISIAGGFVRFGWCNRLACRRHSPADCASMPARCRRSQHPIEHF